MGEPDMRLRWGLPGDHSASTVQALAAIAATAALLGLGRHRTAFTSAAHMSIDRSSVASCSAWTCSPKRSR